MVDYFNLIRSLVVRVEDVRLMGDMWVCWLMLINVICFFEM